MGIPRDYPWSRGQVEIPIWRYQGRAIWGMTARPDGGHQALIEMMKAIRHKRGMAESKNRRLGLVDERYMKQAEWDWCPRRAFSPCAPPRRRWRRPSPSLWPSSGRRRRISGVTSWTALEIPYDHVEGYIAVRLEGAEESAG